MPAGRQKKMPDAHLHLHQGIFLERERLFLATIQNRGNIPYQCAAYLVCLQQIDEAALLYAQIEAIFAVQGQASFHLLGLTINAYLLFATAQHQTHAQVFSWRGSTPTELNTTILQLVSSCHACVLRGQYAGVVYQSCV